MSNWEPNDNLALPILIAFLNGELDASSQSKVEQYLEQNPEEQMVIEGLETFRGPDGSISKALVEQFLNNSKSHLPDQTYTKKKRNPIYLKSKYIPND